MKRNSFVWFLFSLLLAARLMGQAELRYDSTIHEVGVFVGSSMYQMSEIDSGRYCLQSFPATLGAKFLLHHQERMKTGIGIFFSPYYFGLDTNKTSVNALTTMEKRIGYLNIQLLYEFNVILRRNITIFVPLTMDFGLLVIGNSIRRGTVALPNSSKQFRSLTGAVLLGVGAIFYLPNNFGIELSCGGRLPLSEVSKGDGRVPIGIYGQLGGRFAF